MAVLLALLSACASAVNLVLQRDSSRDAPADVRGWRVLPYLFGNLRWLLGEGAWIVAFGLQALALHIGHVSVVQPVLVTELVFTLLIRRYASRWAVRPAAWASAALLCASLSVFLVAAEPRGGHALATRSAWVWALLLSLGTAAIAAVLGRTGSPQRKAGCFAVAASVLAALEATLIKEISGTLNTRGLVVVLSGWPLYVFVAVATASGLLVQAALHVGPLTVSQPLLVVVNPLASIALSVWLFGEHFTRTPASLILGGCSFLGLVAGVFLLTATGPRDPVPADPLAEPVA
jgi:drug/metabolite transporter (DMT)-like permease